MLAQGSHRIRKCFREFAVFVRPQPPCGRHKYQPIAALIAVACYGPVLTAPNRLASVGFVRIWDIRCDFGSVRTELKATIQPRANICAATDRQSKPRANSFARALKMLIVSTVYRSICDGAATRSRRQRKQVQAIQVTPARQTPRLLHGERMPDLRQRQRSMQVS